MEKILGIAGDENERKITKRFLEIESCRAFIAEEMAATIDGNLREQKQIREVSLEREKFFSGTLNDMLTFVAVMDPGGKVLFVNNTALDIAGLKPEDVMGKMFWDIYWWAYSEDLQKTIKKNFLRCVAGETITRELEPQKAGGKRIWINFKLHPVSGNNGKGKYVVAEGQDITSRKEAEQRIEESKNELQHYMDHLANFSGRLDRNGRVVIANRTAIKATGLEPEQIIGHLFTDAFWFSYDPEVQHRLKTAISKAIHGKKVVRYDTLVRVKNRFQHMQLSLTPLINGQNQVEYLIAEGTDISELKRAEAENIRTTNHLNAIINSATGFYISTSDLDGKITSWNKEAELIMGYFGTEVVDKMNISQMCPEKIAESGQLKKLLKEVPEKGRYEGEFEFRKKSGDTFLAYLKATPLKDEDEKLMGVLAIIQDISDLKKAEEKVRLVQEEKIGLIEQTTEAIISIGMDARIEIANPSAEKLFGRDQEKLRTVSIGSILISPSIREVFLTTDNKLKSSFGMEEIKGFEAEVSRSDGIMIPVMLNAAVRKDRRNRVAGLVMAISDMREQKKLQKELLDLAHKSGMAEIATGVLHNINNVLTSVNISSELLRENIRNSKIGGLAKAVAMMQEHPSNLGEYIDNDPRGRLLPEYFEKVTGALKKERENNFSRANSLLGYIEQIKDLIFIQQSYARAGGLSEKINPAEILDDAVGMLANSFDRYNIKVVRDYCESPEIICDRQKLMQSLLNLVKNAREALLDLDDDREPVLGLKIATRNHTRERTVLISVRDNGVGISDQDRTRIFEYGFTTKQYGSGFGLHATALSIKEMGGNISVQSNGVGNGTEFVVELPY